MDVNTRIEKLKDKISNLNERNINEAQTKDWLIRPFFESLGWDFSNPNEVIPEDGDLAGKRCDYNFCIDSKSKFLVEAKSLNDNLDDIKMIYNKLNYCSNTGVPILIITNGNLYRVYFAELKGTGNDKLLKEFKISDAIDFEFIDKLSKEAFAADKLMSYARNFYLFTNIKIAIEKLFISKNKQLINQINNVVKDNLGHKFGDDEIEDALKYFQLVINNDLAILPSSVMKETVKSIIEDKKSKEIIEETKTKNESEWTLEHHFPDEKRREYLELYNNLLGELRKNNIDFEEKFAKKYIGFVSNKSNYFQVHIQNKGIKAWLTMGMDDVPAKYLDKVRDVSNVGHWGIGNTECYIQNESDFNWLIPLIKIAYDKKN